MILLLGASGLMGQTFSRHLSGRGLTFQSVARGQIDLADASRLSQLLTDSRAEFLINAAGYVGRPNIDACEQNQSECREANVLLPQSIRDACAISGVPWGHVSSGCIYAGTRSDGSGYREIDAPNFTFDAGNCSYYSGTKAAAEEHLSKAHSCYLWRARLPFWNCDHARNYVSKLIRYDKLLNATNSLSQLDEFVAACLDCWRLRVPFGTYNLTNGGAIETSEITAMLQRTIATQHVFEFFKSFEEFRQKSVSSPRASCVLDNNKALNAGLKLTEVHEAIASCLDQWRW